MDNFKPKIKHSRIPLRSIKTNSISDLSYKNQLQEKIDVLESQVKDKAKKVTELSQTCAQEISKSEKLNQKKNELEQNIRLLEKKSGEKSLELGEANSKLLELNEKNKKLAMKSENLEKEFKEHIVKVHLRNKPNLYDESLGTVLHIYELNRNLGESKEKMSETESKGEIINPLSEDYTTSQKCVCGNEKWYGSKGCADCKKKVDKLRKRLNVGMENAWKEHWKDFGIPMEEPLEEEGFSPS